MEQRSSGDGVGSLSTLPEKGSAWQSAPGNDHIIGNLFALESKPEHHI